MQKNYFRKKLHGKSWRLFLNCFIVEDNKKATMNKNKLVIQRKSVSCAYA